MAKSKGCIYKVTNILAAPFIDYLTWYKIKGKTPPFYLMARDANFLQLLEY